LLLGTTFVSKNAWYIKLIENLPFELSDHLKIFGRSVKCMLVNLITKLYQDCKFSVTKFLLKETFNGLELKMSATVALFFG
jgi:hypothetical protein